jgi:hypothetical protein
MSRYSSPLTTAPMMPKAMAAMMSNCRLTGGGPWFIRHRRRGASAQRHCDSVPGREDRHGRPQRRPGDVTG